MVLQKGKIVEQGTHDALVAAGTSSGAGGGEGGGGVYARLVVRFVRLAHMHP